MSKKNFYCALILLLINSYLVKFCVILLDIKIDDFKIRGIFMEKTAKGHLLALFTVGVWGTTFISTKVLLRSFGAVEIMIFRFIIGYLLLFLMRPKLLKLKKSSHEGLFALAGACGVTLYFLFENFALTYTYASNVSVIISAAPLFTAVLAALILKANGFSKKFFVGFALAMIGIIIISFNGSSLKLNPLGDILAVLSAFVWAFYSILLVKIGKYGYDKILASRRIFFYGIIFMLPMMGIFGFNFDVSLFKEPVLMGNILFLGVVASAGCYVTWNRAVDILGPVKTSIYIYLQPVITVAVSIAVLRENITGLAFVGMGFTLLGLIISQFDFKKKAVSEKG